MTRSTIEEVQADRCARHLDASTTRFSNRFRDRDSDAKVKLTSEVDGRLTDEKPVKNGDGDVKSGEETFQKGRGDSQFTLEYETGDECESGDLDWKAKAK